MPIFEYLCKDCGHTFEKIVPRYDSTVDCSHCHSAKVEKQLSVFAVAGGSSSSQDFAAPEGGGCGHCGAAQPGSCGLD
jgi:putative FmdB family regulatory protein